MALCKSPLVPDVLQPLWRCGGYSVLVSRLLQQSLYQSCFSLYASCTPLPPVKPQSPPTQQFCLWFKTRQNNPSCSRCFPPLGLTCALLESKVQGMGSSFPFATGLPQANCSKLLCLECRDYLEYSDAPSQHQQLLGITGSPVLSLPAC